MTFRRALFWILSGLCGLGLLVSWVPDPLAWEAFQSIVDALLLVWCLVSLLKRTTQRKWPITLFPLLAVLVLGFVQISMSWTVYRFATYMDVLRWSTFAMVLFLALQTADDGARQRRFCAVATWFGLGLSLESIFQHFLADGKIFWLFTPGETPSGYGPFLNHDHFASFIALVLPASAWEMRHSVRRRWVYGITTAALYACAVASDSRAGFALVTVEVLVLFAFLGLSGRVVTGTATLITVFVAVVGWESLYDRYRLPDPYAGRRELVQSTLRMIQDNPWKGTGLGTWTTVYPSYAIKDLGATINAAHNDWVQWAADGGVPMAAAMLVLFLGAAWTIRRTPWALGAPIVLLHSLIDFPMQGRFLPAAVFLVLGTAAGAASAPIASRPEGSDERPPES